MNENQNTEQKSMNLEWNSLWEVTKKWAVMSQWELEQERYADLKKHYDENIYV